MKLVNNKIQKLQNAIVYFCQNTKYCGKTKLMKLLYFLDFIHYRQTGKSVTGQSYFAWKRGPVPVDVYKDLTGTEDKGLGLCKITAIIPKGERLKMICPKKGIVFNKNAFSEREVKILKTVAEIFRDSKAEDIVEVSHLRNHPWERTLKTKGENKRIDYELALDGSEDQADPEIFEVVERQISEMQKLFGG